MAQYVKFLRGTMEAYEKCRKNSDTLYFVTEQDQNTGKLYLGEKLLTGTTDLKDFSIGALKDVLLSENIANDSLLVYDSAEEAWVNKTIDEQFPVFGAVDLTIPGLVPGVTNGETNLFLKSDGTWASIDMPDVEVKVSDKIFIKREDGTIDLLGFEEAESGAQLVKLADGTIGWVKPDTTTVEGLSSAIETLQTDVQSLNTTVSSLGTTVSGINSAVGQLTTDVGDLETEIAGTKQDIATLAANVYTKEQTDEAIQTEVAKASHLKRKNFDTRIEAEIFVAGLTDEELDSYVIMIATDIVAEADKYDEYLITVVDGKRTLEKIGSWEVDLTNYATKEELATLDNRIGFNNPNPELTLCEVIEETYATKEELVPLATKEALNLLSNDLSTNYAKKTDFVIETVNADEFTLENKNLSINKISIDKVDGLVGFLNDKVDKEEGKSLISTTLIEKVENLYDIKAISSDFECVDGTLSFSSTVTNRLSGIETSVSGLEGKVNTITEAITWGAIVPEE